MPVASWHRQYQLKMFMISNEVRNVKMSKLKNGPLKSAHRATSQPMEMQQISRFSKPDRFMVSETATGSDDIKPSLCLQYCVAISLLAAHEEMCHCGLHLQTDHGCFRLHRWARYVKNM